MAYDVENAGPGSGQVHNCRGIQPVDEMPTLLS